MILQHLEKHKAIHPPKWLSNNTHYIVLTGSDAHGISSNSSDIDYYGFCLPPKELTFPHLGGEIPGFGTQIQRFEQYQQHHCKDPDGKDKEYDITIYSIVKYFQLCLENNPNMLDSLFVPRRCIHHSTEIGELVREHRKIFLSKKAYYTHKGFAYSQMQKIRNKQNASNPKRAETIQKFGYDLKFASHLVRLLNQAEQILIEHDLDLERNKEQLKDIRRGQWTMEQVEEYFYAKEKQLEEIYSKSDLRYSPDEERIKQLLLTCLEMHYGSISKALTIGVNTDNMISEIEEIINKYRRN